MGPSFIDGVIETLAPAIMPRWLPRFMKNAASSAVIPIVKYARSAESASGGAADMPYVMDNIRLEYIKDDPGVPIGAWRSVGNSQHAFVIESFMDEIASWLGERIRSNFAWIC